MKKLIPVLLTICLLLIGILPVSALENPFDEEKLNLTDDLTPAEIQQLNKEEAEQYKKVLKFQEKQVSNQKKKRDASAEFFYNETKILYVPYHKQLEPYWCGPASDLQIIHYNGKLSSVTGSTEYEKQKTIATKAGTTTAGSNTANLKNVLNTYLSSIHTWVVKRIDSSTGSYDALWNVIDYNIFSSKQPVLVLVETKYLPYYKGHSSRHYIVVDGLTKVIHDGSSTPVKADSSVRIVDPNPNSTYTGVHTVKFGDLYNAAKGYFETGSQTYNIAY